MSGDGLHALADARSLALHRANAERLRVEPELVDAARSRVAGWQRERTVAAYYADAWATLLDGDRERLLAILTDPGEEVIALRHVTPFSGVVDPRTRWQIWQEERAAFERRAAP